jgi:hypothetical protein
VSSAADQLTLDTLDLYLRSLRVHGRAGGRRPAGPRKPGAAFLELPSLRLTGLGR